MTVKFSCLYLFPFLLFGQTFEVSKSSKITYYGSHFTSDWQGHSSGLRGTIVYDAVNQTTNSCSLRVDLATFDSGNSHRDSNMLTYLDVFQYPEGMFVSNEPGYYKEGYFGIRIENLVYIKKNKFEELTMAPIEKDLIKKRMLNKKEIVWLNKYHAKVKNNLFKFMNFEEKTNLIKACSPI